MMCTKLQHHCTVLPFIKEGGTKIFLKGLLAVEHQIKQLFTSIYLASRYSGTQGVSSCNLAQHQNDFSENRISLIFGLFLKMRTSENRTTEIRRSQGPGVITNLTNVQKYNLYQTSISSCQKVFFSVSPILSLNSGRILMSFFFCLFLHMMIYCKSR